MKSAVNIAAVAALVLIWAPRLGGFALLTPDPPPVKVASLSVLVVSEQGEGGLSEVEQGLPLLLRQRCGENWRAFDDDLTLQQLSGEPQWVRDAAALPRTSAEWIVAVDSDSYVSRPLPGTLDAVTALLAEVSP